MARMNQAMSDLLRYNAAITPNKRSSFNKSHSHTTTFDSGYIIPLMWDRVLPGDEKKIKYSGLARMSTPIHPTMDDANLDVWCFYVPDRLWWTHAKEFYGENKDASFNPDGEYEMPSLLPSQYAVTENPDGNSIGSLNDYFGMPYMGMERANERSEPDYENNSPLRVTAGLHRSYQLIWNEWFRNSSIQPALQLNDGDTVTTEEWRVIRQLRKANKYPDYFTTLLREPQAGADVFLPVSDEFMPVFSGQYDVPETIYSQSNPYISSIYGRNAMRFLNTDDPSYSSGNDPASTYWNDAIFGISRDGFGGLTIVDRGTDGSDSIIAPANLWARITDSNLATINNLRNAVTVMHLLEIDNRCGKRYQTLLYGHYGVLTPDATLQRPELLGATRTSIGMRQVLQQSATTEDSPLGNVGAFSLTNINNEWICNKSFTEPGFIMVLGCVRPVVSYSQGIDPLLQKLNRYDHYYPVFDNLGNQPVYVRNVYAGLQGSAEALNKVFGYSEAWTEYRIKQNRVSGLMRPDVPGTLSSWNYSLDFDAPPVLDSEFISVDPNLIDRTIAVPSQPQFICDSYFDYIDIKNMSVHSIPGLTRL